MKDNHSIDDFILLQQFLEMKDQESFGILVDRHGHLVMGVCHRILNNIHDAQEASQATFVQLAQKAKKLKPCQPLAAWLYTVARCKALDLYKSRTRYDQKVQRQKEYVSELPNSTGNKSNTGIEALELRAIIDATIQELPKHYRNVVILHFLQGNTHSEISDLLDINPSTISMRITRAKEKLRSRLLKKGITASCLAGITIPSIQAATPSLPLSFIDATYSASLASQNAATVMLAKHPILEFIMKNKVLSATSVVLLSLVSVISISSSQSEINTPAVATTSERDTNFDSNPPSRSVSLDEVSAFDPFELVNTTAGIEDPTHSQLYKFIRENLGEFDQLRNEKEETLLQAAVRHGNFAGTFLLLYHGADPNVHDFDQETPLHQALRTHPNSRGSELLRDMLIYKGANINVCNRSGDTPLIIATELNNYSNVEFLLWMGAELSPSESKTHRYPANIAKEKGFTQITELINTVLQLDSSEPSSDQVPEYVSRSLNEAAAIDDLTTIENLLSSGASIDTKSPKGLTPIYTAAVKLHVETVSYLIFMGANVNAPADNGMTPFMGMTGWMLFEADWIRYMLLLAGAETQTVAKNGHTPLTLAAVRANGSPLQLIIWSGVPPNEASKHGTPMHIASKNGHQRIVKQLTVNGVTEPVSHARTLEGQFHVATRSGDIENLQNLIAAGVSPDVLDERGRTPMLNAIHARRIDVARFLVQEKSDLNFQSSNGKHTPLFATACWDYWEVNNFRQELLIAGADPNICDAKGVSPLIRASKRGVFYSAISQLLYFGADINHRDKHGKSALDYALKSGNKSAANYLIEMGAEQK